MQTWKYPYPVHFFRKGERPSLAYVDEGRGNQTLLFIHGLGSNLKGWQKNINELKKHARCLALDLPGYGKSAWGSFPFTMSFFADTIQHFTEEMKLENVVLIGHSMGGQIAVKTVLQSTENIKKLVLIAPAGFETFSDEESLLIQKTSSPPAIKSLTEEQIVKNFEANFHHMPDDARVMVADRMALRQTAGYDHFCDMIPQCIKGMLAEPIYQDLPRLKMPTLVLFGEQDMLIPNRILHPEMTVKSVAQNGYAQLPFGHLKMIPQAGHFAQWEQHETTNKAILDFISG